MVFGVRCISACQWLVRIVNYYLRLCHALHFNGCSKIVFIDRMHDDARATMPHCKWSDALGKSFPIVHIAPMPTPNVIIYFIAILIVVCTMYERTRCMHSFTYTLSWIICESANVPSARMHTHHKYIYWALNHFPPLNHFNTTLTIFTYNRKYYKCQRARAHMDSIANCV